MSGVDIDFTGTTYPLGPLPPVTREGNELRAGRWTWDLRDDPLTLEDARSVLAIALRIAKPGLWEDPE